MEDFEETMALNFDPEKDVFPAKVKTGDFSKDTLTTKLVGVNFHAQKYNAGGFFAGYMKPEPDNPADPNAIAVYRNNGEIVGYIAKFQLPMVEEFAQGKQLPAIISIWPWKLDGTNSVLDGEVTLIRFFEGETQEERADFCLKLYNFLCGEFKHHLVEFSNKIKAATAILDSRASYESDGSELAEIGQEDVREGANMIKDRVDFIPESYAVFQGAHITPAKDSLAVDIQDVNECVNAVFEEEFGPSKGYVQVFDIHRIEKDGTDSIVGHIPDNRKEEVSNFMQDHRTFCIVYLSYSCNDEDELELVGRILMLRFYAYDSEYNDYLLFKACTPFFEKTVEWIKKLQNDIVLAEERVGGKLKCSKAYYEARDRVISPALSSKSSNASSHSEVLTEEQANEGNEACDKTFGSMSSSASHLLSPEGALAESTPEPDAVATTIPEDGRPSNFIDDDWSAYPTPHSSANSEPTFAPDNSHKVANLISILLVVWIVSFFVGIFAMESHPIVALIAIIIFALIILAFIIALIAYRIRN